MRPDREAGLYGSLFRAGGEFSGFNFASFKFGTAVTGYARPACADSESGLCSVTVTLWADSESVAAVTDFTTTYYRPARADSESYPRLWADSESRPMDRPGGSVPVSGRTGRDAGSAAAIRVAWHLC